MYYDKLQDNEYRPLEHGSEGFLLKKSGQYLGPLLAVLDSQLDKRLVRTFFDVFMVILSFRNRSLGLLLSELGAYICGPQHAPAGTKRLSNLFRSKRWCSSDIEAGLLAKAQGHAADLQASGSRVLALWDDSVLEKAESWFAEGLCSVRSSKGKRLTKIKRGYYRPPAQRICVPGFEWSAVLITGLGALPCVGMMRWWTTRGKHRDSRANVWYSMLRKLCAALGDKLVHVLDRGYASVKTLDTLAYFKQDFILRWKSRHHLVNATLDQLAHPLSLLSTTPALKQLEQLEKLEKQLAKQAKATYRLAQSTKAQHARVVWDKPRKQQRHVSIAYLAVIHPERPNQQLYLIIVRDKKRHTKPMYLLTSLNIDSVGLAWEVFFSYMRRWTIEQTFRFGKTELAMESPRLWRFENRLKMLALIALVYDFLLQLWRNWKTWCCQLCNQWAPRTGKRNRSRKSTSIPLYRLRAAIATALNPPPAYYFARDKLEQQQHPLKTFFDFMHYNPSDANHIINMSHPQNSG